MSMKKVILAMSGGVDSAVAGALLLEQGYDVTAVFMHNWEEEDANGVCSAENDYNDVKLVCDKLGIRYYSVNYAKQYKEKVFSYFLEEYANGRTPNPDVLCNREIKFGPFLQYARAMGADYIATGHYCGIRHSDGKHYLTRAVDDNKDQTYFLNQLTQDQLSMVLFPLAGLDKSQVRQLAIKYGLDNATKKDSTGICFIGERNFRQFLSQYLPSQSGDIVDMSGEVVGKHCGLMYYTLGQRRGLGIGGRADTEQGRWFVVDKDLSNNRLLVSHGDEDVLLSTRCVVGGFNWIPEAIEGSITCCARFRHRQALQTVDARLLPDGRVNIIYHTRQRAITPGQYVVLYNDDMCIGGGVVEEVYK